MTETEHLPAENSAAPEPMQRVPHRIRFHGHTKEYFRIWIVNLALSIVTLGIYSAWAKVRTRRYFYGNTEIDGHHFDYHANPVAILKGRIIVVVGFGILYALSNFAPIEYYLVALGILFLIIPWLVNVGLRFNARVTSYRNVRFNFTGSYWRCLWAYSVWPIIPFLPLIGLVIYLALQVGNGVPLRFALVILFGDYLWLFVVFCIVFAFAVFPFATRAIQRYVWNRHQLGSSCFSVNPSLKSLYGAAILCVIFILVSIFAFVNLWPPIVGNIVQNHTNTAALQITGFVTLALGLGLYSFIRIFYKTSALHASLQSMALQGGFDVRSIITPWTYTWILASNLLAAIFTLGMAIPWGKVRAYRYVCNNIGFYATGSLDQFITEQSATQGVASAEFMDADGIEFGF